MCKVTSGVFGHQIHIKASRVVDDRVLLHTLSNFIVIRNFAHRAGATPHRKSENCHSTARKFYITGMKNNIIIEYPLDGSKNSPYIGENRFQGDLKELMRVTPSTGSFQNLYQNSILPRRAESQNCVEQNINNLQKS